MKIKEKFLDLVDPIQSNTIENNKEKIKNRAMLRESQQIAIKILFKLDELGWSQKDLAEKMNVSPQQVNKTVKGKENFTLDTLKKLQDILNIPLLASFYERKIDNVIRFNLSTEIKENKQRISNFNLDVIKLESTSNENVKFFYKEG
jgi:transcriptional regulator with XRE-family HTH domain